MRRYRKESFELPGFDIQLNRFLVGKGLEAHPFNRLGVCQNKPQLISSHNPDAVAFIILSSGKFFDEVLDHFAKTPSISTAFIDSTIDAIRNDIVHQIQPELKPLCYNVDRAPFFHAQTMGFVSGATEYIHPNAVNPDTTINSGCQVDDTEMSAGVRQYGVSIHPRFGGWFAYRILLVLEGASMECEIRPPKPLSFLTQQEKGLILKEYNSRPSLGMWREWHDHSQGPISRYCVTQRKFFQEHNIDKRKLILQMCIV